METITQRARLIEREFDEPLHGVVAGYAEMGHSMPLVADTLEVSVSSLKHYCSKHHIRFSRTPLEHREIRGRPPRLHRENGQVKSLTAWAVDLGMSIEGVRKRIRQQRPLR